MQEFQVFGGFLMLDIKFIAFARYPPRPDTSHDGGLVGPASLSHESYVSSQILLQWIAVASSC